MVTNVDKYREQHKQRLSFMPWLYFSLKPKHLEWARPWQNELQAYMMDMEDIEFGENCFVSPDAHLFAEPGRKIIIGDNSFIGADVFLHGPITIGENVGINHHCSFDGGSAGIFIGDDCRIAAHCTFYAFNHGMQHDRKIHEQPSHSKGIHIGNDVWLGAQSGVVDGVNIGDSSVIGMSSLVCKDIPARSKAVGNPCKVISVR
jgi:acetyltransferase-like isoleucine patch superfamily enzyme